MPAISVGSVEVDVLPNARGVRQQMQRQLVPAADEVGEEIGRIIGRHVSTQVADAIRSGVTTGGRTAQAPAARQGQAMGSTFARSLRTTLEAALRNLPEVRLNANSTDAQREIYQIRNQLRALQDSRIGIDISSADAVAAINALQARLQRLSASDADVAIRVDAAGAATTLAAIQAQVNRLDGQTANVDVDTRSAAANLNLLTTAAITFGPAILPVLPVVAAGLGAIAAAGVAAAVGVGAVGLVAIPAFKGIATTLQAQKAAQDAAANATYKGGQAASQGASKALQLAGAQQALATASRNGARQIAQAEAGVQDAVRSAAEASSRAAQQVKQSRRDLADAVQQAADRQLQAAEQVRSAEDSLADAQRSARQAQQDLTQARSDAAAELAELGDRLTNAQLGERDAALSVQEAQERLRASQAKGSKATVVEQQRAQLAYDQAVQRLKEQQVETKALTAEKKTADKAGVEGSQTVKDAQERLREADEAVADQQKALAKARVVAARQQVQSQRDIADAQEKVAESQRNVSKVQEDSARSVARAQEQLTAAQQGAADSIASAQRQIASASQQAADGVDQAAVAQAKYQAELAKLSPTARDTFNAYIGLRSAFKDWSKSLQPAVMPIFTRALIGLKNSLPGLTPFVTAAANAIKGLQDRVSAGFKSPWWKQFKTELAGSTGAAITGLGISFGRIFKGMAGVIGAFLPHMDSISDRMQKITGRFAAWGTSLKGSPAFEKFLTYSSKQGPIVAEALGKVFGAFFDVGKAMSPIGTVLLKVLGGLAEAIGIIAEHAPWLVQGIYAAYVATKLWTIAVWAFNAAMLANPITLIIIGIVALTAAVIYAYNKFGWFRAGVQAAWSGIQTAALWAWNNVLKPTFTAIWEGLQTVGKWASWLWTNAIKPAWNAISLAARILLTAIVVAAIIPIIVAFKILGAIAGWLWANAIRPAFKAIAAISVWLYRNVIKPQFDAMVAVFRVVAKIATWLWRNALAPAFRGIGDAAKWLYTNAIKPVFGWIADRATWVWNKGVKPAFDLLKAGVKAVGAAFKTAKDYIGEQWSKVSALARKPIQYIVDVVYNNGVRGVWNKVASAFGAPQLKKFTFESGGIMPGYTPGRDVHKFVSPTGGALELSGGEAIMRPEFTRAVGSGFVGAMNSIAKSRGAQGVKAALAPVFGGNPSTPTDTSLRYASGGITQSFADGGIFGWIGNAASKVAGAGSAAWNGIKKGASWLKDTLEASARAGVKNVVDPLLKSFPGMDTGFGKLVRGIPTGIVDALFGYSKDADKKGGGGVGGPKIQAALKWAKTQNGLPYQWGGNGNPSWDCSGLVSAIESVIRGQKPHRRWATGSFSGNTAPPGWEKSGASAFKIGITNAGVGHTAGTLGKVNVESRGGDGVIIGKGARGYNDKLFTSWYGFQPGKYDSGGYLQPGLNLAYNGTGRPEPVFTAAQSNALTSMANRSATQQLGDLSLNVWVGNEGIASIARAEVHNAQGELIQVLNAN